MASVGEARVGLPPYFRRPIAHRGLHDGCGPGAKDAVFENTQAAFEAAIDAGFGIECDIRPAAGGQPVVFHDAKVPAGLPVEGRPITSLSSSEIEQFRYADGSPLLTFDAFLNTVGGRAPVLAELKFDGGEVDATFLALIGEAALAYEGPLAFMSFEPKLLEDMARLTPQTPRGIVAKRFDEDPAAIARLGQSEAVRRSFAGDLGATGGSFIAYEIGDLARLPEGKLDLPPGTDLFAWTVRSAEDLETAQRLGATPICEGAAAQELMARLNKS